MTSLMLDTSSYSIFKRGHPLATQAIRSADQILIPSIVIGELLAGFDAGSQSTENRTDLDAFLNIPRVSTVPISSETAERYAHIYVYLRSQGKPIPANDLWIAASAMEQSAALLTSDTHFLQIPQIIVQHLSP